MIRTIRTAVLALAFFSCVGNKSFAIGQSEAIRHQYRLAEIRLLRIDGRRLAGQLLSIDKDSIDLRVPDGVVSVARTDLASVAMTRSFRADYWSVGFYVAVAGYAASTCDGTGWFLLRSTASQTDVGNPILLVAGFGLVGAVVQPLLVGTDDSFDVRGEEGERVWRRLKFKISTLLDDDPWEFSPRIHVSVTGGVVHVPSAVNWTLSNEDAEKKSSNSSFTMLRSLSVGYSLSKYIDAGLRYAILNEPQRDDNLFAYSNYSYWDGKSFSVKHFQFTGQAFLLTLDGHPFVGILKGPFLFHAGGGAGFGRYTYKVRNTDAKILGGKWSAAPTIEHTAEGSGLALTLLGGMDFFLYDGVSIGIAADYTFLPGIKLEGMPAWGFPNWTAGNFSIGFELGVHF